MYLPDSGHVHIPLKQTVSFLSSLQQVLRHSPAVEQLSEITNVDNQMSNKDNYTLILE